MTFTDEGKQIIDSGSSFKEIRLEFPDHEVSDIDNTRICMNTLSLEESISDQSNIVFGKCNASLFKIRVADFSGDIEKARMNVYITYRNADLGYVDVPFGKYILSQNPQRTADRRWRDITATDYMTLFDDEIADWYSTVLYPTSETTRTVKYIRESLCNYIGVTFEETTLINDDLVVGKTIEPESLSGRDLLQNCCEVNACFGHFDYDGVLRWIQLTENTSTATDIEYISTYKSCQYEDYSVHEINSVAIVKEDGGLAIPYEVIPQGEERNRYTITGNILLYGFNQTELTSIAQKIYNKISHLSYRPNTTEVYGHIYMPLGQLHEVDCNVVVGNEYIDSSFRSYLLKRTISGTQAIYQKMESKGDSVMPKTQSHDVLNVMKVLQGKSAKYKRDLDSLEIEYKDFEQQTNSKIEQTAESITEEVAKTYATKTEVGEVDGKFDTVYTKTETDSRLTILSDNINLTVEQIEELQKQINQELESYVGDEQPLPSNTPASTWTEEQKAQKIGTKYYCTDGTAWQWMSGMLIYGDKTLTYNNKVLIYYYWKQISDTGVAEALNIAKEALQTANDTSDTLLSDYSTTREIESAINQTKEEIALSVSEEYATKQSLTSVDGKFANVYTKAETNEEIRLAKGSITSEVSENYATKTEVGNIQVGAENLIINSLDFVGDTHFMFNSYLTYGNKLLTYKGNRICY